MVAGVGGGGGGGGEVVCIIEEYTVVFNRYFYKGK